MSMDFYGVETVLLASFFSLTKNLFWPLFILWSCVDPLTVPQCAHVKITGGFFLPSWGLQRLCKCGDMCRPTNTYIIQNQQNVVFFKLKVYLLLFLLYFLDIGVSVHALDTVIYSSILLIIKHCVWEFYFCLVNFILLSGLPSYVIYSFIGTLIPK